VFASGTLFIFSYFHIHGRIFASFAPPCTAPPIRSGCVLLDNPQDRLLFVDLLLEKLDVTSDSHRPSFSSVPSATTSSSRFVTLPNRFLPDSLLVFERVPSTICSTYWTFKEPHLNLLLDTNLVGEEVVDSSLSSDKLDLPDLREGDENRQWLCFFTA
jgi:hypothetical protein